MTKRLILILLFLFSTVGIASCDQERHQTKEVKEIRQGDLTEKKKKIDMPKKVREIEEVIEQKEDSLVYLKVKEVSVSSFDTTPDWAPLPNPNAVVDGSLLTRWSSDYFPLKFLGIGLVQTRVFKSRQDRGKNLGMLSNPEHHFPL